MSGLATIRKGSTSADYQARVKVNWNSKGKADTDPHPAAGNYNERMLLFIREHSYFEARFPCRGHEFRLSTLTA
jgi:hypothetical protein